MEWWMSTRVVLMLRTDGDRQERLLAFLSSMLPATRETQGCEGLFLCRSDTDPTMFVVDQQWASRDHYLAYARWRRDRGDLAPFDELLTSPPTLKFYSQLESW
jgi:quinol monooxygenase YgiN